MSINRFFFFGDAFFSGFYLNEIVLRLCSAEVEMPETFVQYHQTLAHLQHLSSQENPNLFLRQILRQFEHALLEELGYAIDFSVDANQEPIQPNLHYHFQLNDGFIPTAQASRANLLGAQILICATMKKVGILTQSSYNYCLGCIDK